jgi:hypothetical protein
MIVFDLCCEGGHRFEGWFASSAEFARQHESSLVSCPECGSVAVEKAPMAPAVPRKTNQLPVQSPGQSRARSAGKEKPVARGPLPAELAEALVTLAQAQAKALENSRWVGEAFAEESRAMHYGEREPKPIHGQATANEARELIEEGIAVAPLPFPVAPPEELN